MRRCREVVPGHHRRGLRPARGRPCQRQSAQSFCLDGLLAAPDGSALVRRAAVAHPKTRPPSAAEVAEMVLAGGGRNCSSLAPSDSERGGDGRVGPDGRDGRTGPGPDGAGPGGAGRGRHRLPGRGRPGRPRPAHPAGSGAAGAGGRGRPRPAHRPEPVGAGPAWRPRRST